MENNNKRLKLMFEKYTWNITNFSKLDYRHCSDKFILDDHTWQIAIYPMGGSDDYLEIYLEADVDCANLPESWKKVANFNLALINQVNNKRTIRKGCEFEFNAHDISWGFDDFLPLHEHKDPGSGFIVNDTCIIEVGIFVTKYVFDNHEDKSVCKIDDNPIKDNVNPLFHEMFRSSFENIEQNFVPLLEEVCLQHPSLIASQENRSCRFTEWAFTALGRVLHFLNTKKVKDMDDEACNYLQILWDELKTFGFDLTWLEFYVQSALDVKKYLENAVKVRKAKENVDALKIETERLKAMVIERETELEMASRDLVKAEEGFKERNLDAQLGYGRDTFIN